MQENQPTPTGILLDNRTDEQKSSDYRHEEIAAGFAPHIWKEESFKPYYYFPFDQASSLSCVAAGGAISLEHYDGNIVSRKDIYTRRVNYPGGGMMMSDLMKIIADGVALESTIPSQGLGEAKMNERYPTTPNILMERDRNRTGLYFNIAGFRDIDTLASISDVVPVVIFWYFDKDGQEWWREYPVAKFNFDSYVAFGVTRHQATLVKNGAILIGGKKYLIIQDSAGVGTGLGENNNLRLISEEFLMKRAYAASYALDNDNELLTPINMPTKPKFSLTGTLKVEDRGPNVSKLQEVLIYEGILRIAKPTGYFGGLTKTAVIKLQEKYAAEILTPVGLKRGTGIAAASTLKFLRNKYQ